MQHEREAIGLAGRVRQHEAANAVNPAHGFVGGRFHFDRHIAELLARDHAIHRIVAVAHRMVVPVTQPETLAVIGDGRAERPQLGHAVHRERSLVRPDDPLVGLDQDHALGEPRDDLVQLAPIGMRLQRLFVYLFVHRMVVPVVSMTAGPAAATSTRAGRRVWR